MGVTACTIVDGLHGLVDSLVLRRVRYLAGNRNILDTKSELYSIRANVSMKDLALVP